MHTSGASRTRRKGQVSVRMTSERNRKLFRVTLSPHKLHHLHAKKLLCNSYYYVEKLFTSGPVSSDITGFFLENVSVNAHKSIAHKSIVLT